MFVLLTLAAFFSAARGIWGAIRSRDLENHNLSMVKSHVGRFVGTTKNFCLPALGVKCADKRIEFKSYRTLRVFIEEPTEDQALSKYFSKPRCKCIQCHG